MMLRADWRPAIKSAGECVLGMAALGLITAAALQFQLQPGTVSLLYMIVVVFISLRAGFGWSIAVSLVAVFLLQHYFRPVFSADGSKNPLALVAIVVFLFTAWVITAMVARVRVLTEAQLRSAFEQRLAERTRIARELHDTLLQSFQALLLHFQAVDEMLPPGSAKEALEKALDRAEQAITEGRDAIQNLRSPAHATNELAQAITALGEQAGGESGNGISPAFRVSVEGTPRELHPIVRDEIYWVAREAVQNAFRHACAKQVEAEIAYGAAFLRVRIRDDGKGIDAKVLENGRDGHWGLTGMRERARNIGGRLEIWSKPGAGTEVDLSAPASVAYLSSEGKAKGTADEL